MALGDADAAGVERLRLLASAISGRPLEVGAVEAGGLPWTDGNTVFVGADADFRAQVRAVSLQASLLGAGSLEPDVLASLGNAGRLVRRYLALEGHRALRVNEALLPACARSLLDVSIALRVGSPAESSALARTREALPDAPVEFGTIKPRQVRAAPRSGSEHGAEQHVPRTSREAMLRELDDGEETPIEMSPDVFNPVGGGGAVGRMLQRLLGTSRSKGQGQPGADSATHVTRRGGLVGSRAGMSRAQAVEADIAEAAHGAITYPEWDVHRHRYKPDWCRVVEIDVEVGSGPEPVFPEARGLRRPLARLGMELERRRRQPQGDELDIDATVQARVDLVAGSAPDESVYVDSLRGKRDLSVLVLLDVSGSAGEPSASGPSVHEHQTAAAGALASALYELGDRTALYGFRSYGREAVQVMAVMRFGERFDATVAGRLGALVPGAYTRLGAAIRHGASILESEGGTARRLLVVLSDGFAYDHGYGGAYGEADARRSLAEARRRGTACLCLSVGAETDIDSLRRVFGTAAYAVIPRSGDLPRVVGPLFRSALRLAEVQRRTSQRNERTHERLNLERSVA